MDGWIEQITIRDGLVYDSQSVIGRRKFRAKKRAMPEKMCIPYMEKFMIDFDFRKSYANGYEKCTSNVCYSNDTHQLHEFWLLFIYSMRKYIIIWASCLLSLFSIRKRSSFSWYTIYGHSCRSFFVHQNINSKMRLHIELKPLVFSRSCSIVNYYEYSSDIVGKKYYKYYLHE